MIGKLIKFQGIDQFYREYDNRGNDSLLTGQVVKLDAKFIFCIFRLHINFIFRKYLFVAS
jgi:hypothetical protein